MNKFKVGDRVRLVRMEDEKSIYKEYLNKIFTIKRLIGDLAAELKETKKVVPYLKNLELVKDKYTYEDLKKAPIGTKLIFKNGYLIKFDNKRVYGVINGIYYNGRLDYIILFMKGKVTDERFGKIMKIEKPIYKTVYEYKEEILDEAEKRYLKAVVRPYKDVKSIKKHIFPDREKASILISGLDLNYEKWAFLLPPFQKDTMYKGMETNKEYTLEELGL